MRLGSSKVRGLSEENARKVFLDAGLSPLEPFAGAKYKWLCECLTCGHRYSPDYSSVNAGHGCPACFKSRQAENLRRDGLRIAIETCRELDYELVGTYANARTAVEIRCKLCLAEFKTTLGSLRSESKKCACRKEARKKLSEHRPDLFEEIDWERNPGLTAKRIGTGYTEIIFWKCKAKQHSFRTSPAARVNGEGKCLVCGGFMAERGVNDFATLHPGLAKQFIADPKDGLLPYEVLAGSSRKFIWQCPNNELHKYSRSPWGRVKGEGCPYCANSNKKVLKGDNDLASNYPELVAEWDFSKNLTFGPDEVVPGSQRRVNWICYRGHEWVAPIQKRTNGSGCEKCFWFEPGRNDLGTIGSQLLRDEWNAEKNGKAIGEVSPSNAEKYFWTCVGCRQSFKASPVNRHYNNTGCPDCASTGYSPLKPSTLYFLRRDDLKARKIGKTNTFTAHNRIGRFQTRGWKVVARWDLDTGHSIDFTEKAALGWLREELGLPQYLSREDMRGMAGQTETFSIDGPSDSQVVEKIGLLFRLWDDQLSSLSGSRS